MENKIQELTEKIYAEGVEKGKVEADRLVAEAKAKAADIIKDAQRQAENLIAAAQKKVAELDANTRSEIKLYGAQAVGALKSEATDIITDAVVKSAVKAAFFHKFIVISAFGNFTGVCILQINLIIFRLGNDAFFVRITNNVVQRTSVSHKDI